MLDTTNVHTFLIRIDQIPNDILSKMEHHSYNIHLSEMLQVKVVDMSWF